MYNKLDSIYLGYPNFSCKNPNLLFFYIKKHKRRENKIKLLLKG